MRLGMTLKWMRETCTFESMTTIPMGLLLRLPFRRKRRDPDEVEVSERNGIRSLHLGSDTVQSSMRISDPTELVLSYTRAMMGFMLFHPQPRHFLMIGLGGGSLAKFCYHRLETSAVTVIENNPKVVAAARMYFELPENDQRLRVVEDDGAAFVRVNPNSCDVLMVDAYDGHSQVLALASEGFYADAFAALDANGVMVVNLWSSDDRFDLFLQRIERAFDGMVLCLPAERRGNVAVFAFKRRPTQTRWDQLRDRAKLLQMRTGLEFPKFVTRLADLNPHTDNRLLI